MFRMNRAALLTQYYPEAISLALSFWTWVTHTESRAVTLQPGDGFLLIGGDPRGGRQVRTRVTSW
jgi:hypothetical protein